MDLIQYDGCPSVQEEFETDTDSRGEQHVKRKEEIGGACTCQRTLKAAREPAEGREAWRSPSGLKQGHCMKDLTERRRLVGRCWRRTPQADGMSGQRRREQGGRTAVEGGFSGSGGGAGLGVWRATVHLWIPC